MIRYGSTNFSRSFRKKTTRTELFTYMRTKYAFLSSPARLTPTKLMLQLCTPNIFVFDLPQIVWSRTSSPPSPVTIFAESFTQNMNVVIFVIQKAYMLYELGLDQRNLACEFADDFPVSQKSKDTCRHEKIILSHTLTTLAINHHQV